MYRVSANGTFVAPFFGYNIALSYAVQLCIKQGDFVTCQDVDSEDYTYSCTFFYRNSTEMVSWEEEYDNFDFSNETLEETEVRLHLRNSSLQRHLDSGGRTFRELGGRREAVSRSKRLGRRADRRVMKELLKEDMAA